MKICYVMGALKDDAYQIKKKQGDIIIAADAGYENLNGQKPDIVVGDFDSLGYVPENENVIQHPVHKDDTDTMLAVKTGLNMGYEKFVILGGLGGKLDHTIANIQTLAYINEHGAAGCLAGTSLSAVLLENGDVSFDESAIGRISVFSYGKDAFGVTLEGLEYPLADARLTDCFPLGVSNAFTGLKSRVSVSNGRLLVIWEGPIDKSDFLCNY